MMVITFLKLICEKTVFTQGLKGSCRFSGYLVTKATLSIKNGCFGVWRFPKYQKTRKD